MLLYFCFIFSTQAGVICNHLHFPLLSSLQVLICSYLFRSITNIYHKDETSEYSVFLFSMVCSKAVCSDGCLGVPLRVGLSATSPRYAVGFSLQSLTWVKYPKSLLSNIIITKYNAIIPFTSLKNTKSSAVGTLSYLSSVRYFPSYPE